MPKTSHNSNSIKSTTSTKITAEQAIIIIRLIKKYKCLWDRNHPDFRKNQIRYKTFKKIGSYFCLTAEEVIKKYRRYRNCYIHELKQIQTGKKSHSNLFYFDEMDFLRDVVEFRSMDGKFSPNLSLLKSDVLPDTDEETQIESLDEEYALEPMEECHLSSYDSSAVVEIKEEKPLDIGSESAIEEEGIVEEIHPDEVQVNDQPRNNEDEFDIFSKYLARQLREMDKLSALETMEELQRIIFRRRIQILKSSPK